MYNDGLRWCKKTDRYRDKLPKIFSGGKEG